MSFSQLADSYLSTLDSLVFDTPSETVQTEKDIAEELDLWSNAQFTFDCKPGVGIYDEEKSKNTSPVTEPTSHFEGGLDPITYESLVNYLDYELPSRPEVKLEPVVKQQEQQKKTQKKQRIQPRPLAPALPTLVPVVAPSTRQVLMPKPTVVLPNSPLSSSPTIEVNPTSPKKGTKRTQEEEDFLDDSTTPEEDKRRRNTAASARFRVKKKMREQAMEQSVREMSVKSEKLQDKVNQLEIEIKFLRSLLLDKASSK